MLYTLEGRSQGGTEHTHRDRVVLDHVQLGVVCIDLCGCCQLQSLESRLEHRIKTFHLAAVNTEKPACLRLFSSWQKVTRIKPGAEDSSFACLNSLCGLSLPQGCQAAFEMCPDWSPLLQIKPKPRVAPRHEPWTHLLTLFRFEKDSNRRLTRPF